jgi:uncharacterized protein HemX
MKAAVIGSAILICLLLALGFFIAERERRQIYKAMDSLSVGKSQTIDADSLRDVIEAKVIDSMKVLLMDQDRKIVDLAKRINTNRRQYENLKKRVDSISVDMPDF